MPRGSMALNESLRPPQPFPAPCVSLTISLRLVAESITAAGVTDKLVVNRRRVHAHLRAVYRKLDVRTRSAASSYVVEHNLC